MPESLYHYGATVESVYDGDTVTPSIDLGFKSWLMGQKIRLYGIDTPEIRGPERPEGLVIRDQVREAMPIGSRVVLESIRDKSGKYGRWLGRIHLPNGECLNDTLINQGFAREY